MMKHYVEVDGHDVDRDNQPTNADLYGSVDLVRLTGFRAMAAMCSSMADVVLKPETLTDVQVAEVAIGMMISDPEIVLDLLDISEARTRSLGLDLTLCERHDFEGLAAWADLAIGIFKTRMPVEDFAHTIGVTEQTIRRYCRDKKLDSVWFDNGWWILSSEVERWNMIAGKTGRPKKA